MAGFFMFLHAVISILLVVVILMQSGRGGGLTEAFASAESMFGAQTNEFMVKATTVIATLFFLMCLGLAIFSAQKGKSLMTGSIIPQEQAVDGETQIPKGSLKLPAITVPEPEALSESSNAIPIKMGAEESRSPVLDIIPLTEK